MRCPSVAKLQEAFRDLTSDQAKLIKKLCKVVDDPMRFSSTIHGNCPATDKYASSMYSDPYESPMWRRTLALHAIDQILGTCGVEALGPCDAWDTPPPYEYLNTGDTYGTTLIYRRKSDHLFIGNWGSIAERHPNW